MEDTKKDGTFSAEEVERIKQEALNAYKSDQEKGIQKLINETKFKDKVIDATGKVAQNAEALIDIYNSDKEVGQAILDKYYEGQSFEEYKNSIGYKESPEVITENLITEKINSITKQNRINDKKESFLKKVNLEGEQLTAFENELNERMQLKGFDIDKDLIKTYKYVTGYSEAEVKAINKTKDYAKATGLSGTDKSGGKSISNEGKQALDFWKKHS